MKRGAIFGDSLAKGAVFDTKLGKYTYISNSCLGLVEQDLNVQIDNYAKFGCTVTRALSALFRRRDELKDFDFVALELGGNDSDFDWRAISENPDAEHQPRTPIDAFRTEYRSMVEEIQSAGSRAIIINMPPLDDKKYFKWISRDLNADNILKWLGGDTGYIYRFHESYNTAVTTLATEMGVPVLDVRSSFTLRRDYPDFLCVDGIHLNEKGHRLCADQIEQSVKRLLESK